MVAQVEIDLECQACSRNETRYNLPEETKCYQTCQCYMMILTYGNGGSLKDKIQVIIKPHKSKDC